MKSMSKFIWVSAIILCLASCMRYSFKGVSISPETKTYYIHPIEVTAIDAPSGLQYTLREAMQQKIQSQSSLVYTELDPNIEFVITINGYTITTEAATNNNTVTLNKLTISVSSEYINNNDEKDTWQKNFSYGVPFDPNIDINTVQDQFIAEIFDQVTDQIFQEAFTQW